MALRKRPSPPCRTTSPSAFSVAIVPSTVSPVAIALGEHISTEARREYPSNRVDVAFDCLAAIGSTISTLPFWPMPVSCA